MKKIFDDDLSLAEIKDHLKNAAKLEESKNKKIIILLVILFLSSILLFYYLKSIKASKSSILDDSFEDNFIDETGLYYTDEEDFE